MTVTLSAREGAGLYLVRRARTLTAPHQVRLLATAFLALLVVDLGRIYLSRLALGEPVPWLSAVSEVLLYAAMALVLWHPLAGLCLTGVALSISLVGNGTGTEPTTLLIVGALIGARGTPRLRWVFLLGVACYLAVEIALHAEQTPFILGVFGGAAVIGLAVGMGIDKLCRFRDRDGRRLAEATTEDARLRADERRNLAHELHDVVTHELSNVSLQAMSHLDSTGDPDEMRRVLKKVNRSTDLAIAEMRLLVRVLRHDAATAAGADEVADLSRRIPPTVAAAEWARRLTDAGFDPAIDIPAQADRLKRTVQGTITRTLDVCCDNILRHSPDRSRCVITLSVSDTQVVFRASSPLPSPPAEDVTLGWGLRALRERVDLTGGAFTAGMSSQGTTDAQWVVVVTLPHD